MDNLFKEFNITSKNEWKAQLEKDLKGINFEELLRIDNNNITIQPFYTQEDKATAGETLAVFEHTHWDVFQHFIVNNEQEINAIALNQLNNGVTALSFEIKDNVNINTLLKDIQLQHICTTFIVEGDAQLFAAALHNYLAQQNLNSSNLQLYILAGTDQKTDHCITIDAECYNNSGANSQTELACIAARLQEQLHLHNHETIEKVYIKLALDTSYFEQIAKLRALRILAKNIFNAYQIAPKLYVHTTTSNIYRSPVDMHSNMLRDTISAMAGVLGGADGITVLPFDYAVALPNSFSYRMACNIQLLLKEEAYLYHVADVSNGSYYIETLTRQLVDAAWSTFLAIETKGGINAATDYVKNLIQAQTQLLIQQYKDKKKTLIGVNKHVNGMENKTQAIRPDFIKNTNINIAQALA